MFSLNFPATVQVPLFLKWNIPVIPSGVGFRGILILVAGKLSIRLIARYHNEFLTIFMSTDTRSAGHFPFSSIRIIYRPVQPQPRHNRVENLVSQADP